MKYLLPHEVGHHNTLSICSRSGPSVTFLEPVAAHQSNSLPTRVMVWFAVITGKLFYQSSPMGTRKGKVQRLATVGTETSSTIQSMSFLRRMAMLLGKILNGCQSWMIVAWGRTPCITSDIRYSWWMAVWSRRTGEVLVEEVHKVEWISPPRPSWERRSFRSSALKRTRRIPCRTHPSFNSNSYCHSSTVEWVVQGLKQRAQIKYWSSFAISTTCHQYLSLIPAWWWCDTFGNPWVQADRRGSIG